MALSAKGLSLACIDPGENTGLWWGCFTPDELKLGPYKAMHAAQDAGRMMFEQINAKDIGEMEAQKLCDEFLQSNEVILQVFTKGKTKNIQSVVIFEDFILRESTMTRDLLSPVRMTSGIQAFMHARGVSHTIGKAQQPSAMKTVVTKERMNKAGFKWSHDRRHEWDAFRHGVLYLRSYCNSM